MVKISIKKDRKPKTKPKQKQKQKQSQKVIVNIGSNAVKARRATSQPIQKNVANKQMPTPNIYVPQSNPLYKQSDSTSEILKYIKESEQQKELIKKQEKSNELEKDKIKKASTVPTEEKAQVQFAMVNNTQDISGLSSGNATPHFNPLSTPLNFRSLQNALGSLIHRADLEGENPNTGRLSLSTYNPPSSGSSFMSDEGYIDDKDSVLSYESRTPLTHTPHQNSLIDFLQNKAVKPVDQEVFLQDEPDQEVITEPQLETVINETQQQEPPMETIINEPSQVDAFIIDTPEPEKTAYEQADEAITMIDDALKPKKKTESQQAEEPNTMIEVKNPTLNSTTSNANIDSLTTPPRYTKAQINKMKVIPIGEVITAEKVKDSEGKRLIFNGQRVFREGKKGQQINLPELKTILSSHYGYSD